MRLEDLLRAAKDIYEKGGTSDDIYSLIIDADEGDYSIAKYSSLDGDVWLEKLHFETYEEKLEFKKEAKRQYIEQQEVTAAIIENVEDDIRNKYPSILIKNYSPEKEYKDAIGIKNDSYFISTKCCINKNSDEYLQYSEIKLYFNMPFNQVEDFFKEYTSYAIENNMPSFFKTRYNNANDMVTVRFKDVDKLDDIVNIIKKYRNYDKTSLLINTYDGIGYTVDNGESFNTTLSNLLYEYVSVAEDIDKDSFIEYLVNKREMAELPEFSISTREEDALYIHLLNLDYLVDGKEFNIDDFKKQYIELLSLEKNTIKENKLKRDFVIDMMNNLCEIGCSDEEKMYESITSIFNDSNSTVELNGKQFKIRDILEYYYKGKIAKDELIHNTTCLLDKKKADSIRSIEFQVCDYIGAMIVEFSKIGFEDKNLMKQVIETVLSNDKVIYSLNNHDLKIRDFINYSMADYIKDNNAERVLFDMSNKMIAFTNKMYNYANSDKDISFHKICNKVSDYEDEVSDTVLGLVNVYDMTKKLLAYKFNIEDESCDSFDIIVEHITKNNESEQASVKVKEK